MSTELGERIVGGLMGHLIGDALGVPYEFTPPRLVPRYDRIEMTAPGSHIATHAGIEPGTWSDDGAQALCLLSSLLEKKGFDARDFAQKLLNWRYAGYCTPDNISFGLGRQTQASLDRIRAGSDPRTAGLSGEMDNGNGSLMRVLPLALWHKGDDFGLVSAAYAQSKVTHGNVRTLVANALYCLWARRLLAGTPNPFEEAASTLMGLYSGGPYLHADKEWSDPSFLQKASQELDKYVNQTEPGNGMGYVLDTFYSVRTSMKESSYEDVVKKAISFGNDTDTVACIAGGLAGIKYGYRAIPERWRKQLRGGRIYLPMLKQLLVHHGLS